MAIYALILALLLTSCGRSSQPIFEQPAPQVVAHATPPPVPVPPVSQSVFGLPEAPVLSQAGESLIIEFEVGGRAGYNPRPELPDLRLSGVTWGIGYDAHQNSAAAILDDWGALPTPQPQRLADTHPFYGRSAVNSTKAVHDILVAWPMAMDVFNRLDVARTLEQCRRAFPGFNDLRLNAQAALVSLVFNRGGGMVGANRAEMREIRDLVPRQDYPGIAGQLRKMERVWVGTSIERGMTRRREAEAKLVLTP